jgi:hypothetical protein
MYEVIEAYKFAKRSGKNRIVRRGDDRVFETALANLNRANRESRKTS